MTESTVNRRRRSYWFLWLVVITAVASLAYLASICLQIVHEASLQQVQPADVIVVFGAAEYAGRPSPVYRARLDHAFDLFQRGVAPVVIVTGGAGDDPVFTEGGVGHDYLMHRGIPESQLVAETQGADTAQSAERVAVIMRANLMRRGVAVSDAYHVFRIRQLLEHEGVQVQVAPRPDSLPRSAWQRCLAVLREAVSYIVWKLRTPESGPQTSSVL